MSNEIGKLAIRNIQIQFSCGHLLEANDSQKEYDEYFDFDDDKECPDCIKEKMLEIINKL